MTAARRGRRDPLVADRLVVEQRVGDAVAGERVDHEALLVGGDHLLRRSVEIEQAAVEDAHLLHERDFGVEPRRGDLPLELAELEDERLLALLHGEQRQPQADDGDDRHDQREQFHEPAHGAPPSPRAAAARRCTSGSGR